MSSTEPTKQQSILPENVPHTAPQHYARFITDTGKILPRKYTGLSAKQQRKVTSIIKTSRNLLTMQ
jgi:small subunit ribosomal protein S18